MYYFYANFDYHILKEGDSFIFFGVSSIFYLASLASLFFQTINAFKQSLPRVQNWTQLMP